MACREHVIVQVLSTFYVELRFLIKELLPESKKIYKVAIKNLCKI